ncbi:MAG: (d)CMP kinase [Candidatus Zixiibacteriota bacterium]|nr:MAG: (d)CMP kinase [candidate division Zixibacteria bacterium]
MTYNLSWLKDKVIAIDGPAGSGKSTTARLVAARLGYKYLDTGAMYRALTYFALRHGISPGDEGALTALAQKLSIGFETGESVNRVFLAGEDVTEEIRSPEVTAAVSEVSAHPGVREAMVSKQRKIGEKGSVVAEGRDTTTVVFPDANLKIYLQATAEQRAQRRLIDLARAGVATTIEDQIADLERRDRYDSTREHSPLTRASDAYVVDTSNCTVEDQVERVLTIFKTAMS